MPDPAFLPKNFASISYRRVFTIVDRYDRNHLMRKMAIFSAVIFLATSSLLLCSCSDANQGQGPSYESRHSKIPGSGAVKY